MNYKNILVEIAPEEEITGKIELEKLRGAQGYNAYELYLRNLSDGELAMSEKEWINSISKTNFYKVYTQRYMDDFNRITEFIPLNISAYNETCIIDVIINGLYIMKDKDYVIISHNEFNEIESDYKYNLSADKYYIRLLEPLLTMKNQYIDIVVKKTVVATAEDFDKLKGENGGADGLKYENSLLQLTEKNKPIGEAVKIVSDNIFICNETETIEDAPEEAKIVIYSGTVFYKDISGNFHEMLSNLNVAKNINSQGDGDVPNAKTVKGYVNSRTLNIKYMTDNEFVAPYNCYAEITYQVSGWGYGGNKTAPAITCDKGNAVKITGFEGGTQGHDTIPDSMVSMAIFQLTKDVEYSFGFGGVTGGSTHSGRIIKLIPIYDEE